MYFIPKVHSESIDEVTTTQLTQSEEGEPEIIPASGEEGYHIKFMIASTMLYFVAVGLSSVSLIFLINERIAGEASDPNSKSIFVQTTVTFLTSASSFLCLRYNSGMGDYLGRKPVIIFSSISLIVTRLLYSVSQLPIHFYMVSVFAGATESLYFSTIAWVCDIIPSHAERSKYYGIFAGAVGLSGVVIGAPVGAAMSISISPAAPLLLSTVFSLASCLVTVANPCCDTLALQRMDLMEVRMITSTRAIPRRMCKFLFGHFPLSKATLEIIQESSKPLDWLTFSVCQWTWALLLLILVQFLLKVFEWSRAVSSLCLLGMGLSLAFVVPSLQSRFEPISLSFYSMGVQAVGFLFLSISGSGVNQYRTFGIVGIALVALGTSWLPCSQSIIMSGYDFGKQGVVSGMVGQMGDFAVLPGYLISLSFTFNLKRGSDHVYWPGCAFGICSAILIGTMWLHHFVHGPGVRTLKRRHLFKDGENARIEVASVPE